MLRRIDAHHFQLTSTDYATIVKSFLDLPIFVTESQFSDGKIENINRETKKKLEASLSGGRPAVI